MPQLKLTGIEKIYGATKALKDGSLSLYSGEVHILVGSNGSGKSTLCKTIAGSVRPSRGTIELHGKPVKFESPADARAVGVSIFFQELSLSNNRTVSENIVLNKLPAKHGIVDRASIQRLAEIAVAPFKHVVGDGFGLDVPVGQLRADQRQLVEIMKTLHSGSEFLIFDEPTSALDRAQSEAFFAELVRRKEQGACIIFISHRMEEVFEIGERVTVLRDGETVFSAKLTETTQDELIAQMVGAEGSLVGFLEPPAVRVNSKVRLTVNNLRTDRLHGISFDLHRGEILGLGGLHGHGQSELLRSLFGLTSATGQVTLDSTPLRIDSPRAAIRQGIAYVSGDRGRDGAITERPILENVIPISYLRRAKQFVFPSKATAEANEALSKLSTKYGSVGDSINSLSGGNQQKVIIARWLIDLPDVLLLDDPTKGIDIATKLELFDLIRRLAEQGMAIILYSSEDAELLANSDRIIVFNNGGVSRELTGAKRDRINLTEASFEAAQ